LLFWGARARARTRRRAPSVTKRHSCRTRKKKKSVFANPWKQEGPVVVMDEGVEVEKE